VSKRKKKPHLKPPALQGAEPVTSKSPRTASDPDSFYQDHPSWQISIIEMCDPYGWHKVDEFTLHDVREKLAHFERMTWNELLVKASKDHHRIPISDICKKAQKRLQHLGQDDIDHLFSLRLSAKERIYGILENGVFRLLWWDPKHAVCPSIKKHT